ncbi:hypothetical protein [Jeotgalibaca porci]|uniref:hypothetical protein n=2 Tax=Jeotgalibaca porci TaxID=1868793 RepID=UPI0035A0E3FF
MQTTYGFSDILNKIQSVDMTASLAKQLYISTLRGNVPVGAVRLNISNLGKKLNESGYNDTPTVEELVVNFVLASIKQTLQIAKYSDKDAVFIANSQFYRVKNLLTSNNTGELDVILCYHILPVGLQHDDPVTLLSLEDPDVYEFGDGDTTYHIDPDTTTYIDDLVIGDFSDLITLYYILANNFNSTLTPGSLPIELTNWAESGIDILDEVLWDSLFSYSTDKIRRWLSTYIYFNY